MVMIQLVAAATTTAVAKDIGKNISQDTKVLAKTSNKGLQDLKQ